MVIAVEAHVTPVCVVKAYIELSSECLNLADDALPSVPQDIQIREASLAHAALPVEVSRNND
jgi:hypothetical protein